MSTGVGSTVITFSKIADFFRNEEGILERGENGYRSGHILSSKFDGKLSTLLGTVQASMRKDVSYNVIISFDANMNVGNGSCTCRRGLDKCHHMASLLLWAYHNVSSTDTLCQWKAPKKKDEQIIPLETMYEGKVQAKVARLEEENVEQFLSNLKLSGVGVGLLWKVSSPPDDDFPIIHAIEDILFSNEFDESTNKKNFLLSAIKLTRNKVEDIEIKTRGQSNNPLWLIARKNRVTASNFGLILKAMQKGSFPPSFWTRLFGLYSLDGVKAVQWGRTHEADAAKAFTSFTGHQVISNGLFLHENGYMAATPDGLIEDDGIFEVKCPYSLRNESSLKKAQSSKELNGFFYFNNDGNIIINPDHNYYHQIQAQLYITGRTKGYFCQWNPQDTVHFVVPKDNSWHHNLAVVEDFYFSKFISKLIERQQTITDASSCSTSEN